MLYEIWTPEEAYVVVRGPQFNFLTLSPVI